MNKKILTTREIADAVDQILRKKYHLIEFFYTDRTLKVELNNLAT